MAARKAYDLLIQAESGLASVTGGPDEPARVGISVVDIATGATAQSAILEALVRRYNTGEGADIRISMFDVMADWLAVPLLHQDGGRPPKRMGLAHPSIAPYGAFTTADGKQVLVSIQSEREWVAFVTKVLRDEALLTDPRLTGNVQRVANRELTDSCVAGVFARLSEAELRERLTQADIAFATINDMAGLSAHPHLRRISVDTPAGPVSCPAPAPIFVGEERTYGPVPALGEGQA
jgi:crotonobetainyl-CoA:carnitine CoA-transferase CaiB-like acyl-CoA transferase